MDASERLIEEVQKRPAIFDKTHDDYCNRVYLNKQWNEIGETLNLDGQAARKKWTSLRDYFARSQRQMTSLKSVSAPGKRRKWYLYDQMFFLLPYIMYENKTCSNFSDVSDQGEEVSDPSEGNQSLPSANVSTSGNVQETPKANSAGQLSMEKEKRKRSKFPQERALALSIDKEILTAIKNIPATASRHDPDDEDELFLKSLIPKMKTLDPVTKWELQAEMQMLVLQYVKRSLHPSTITSPSPTPLYEKTARTASSTYEYGKTSAHPSTNTCHEAFTSASLPSPSPTPPNEHTACISSSTYEYGKTFAHPSTNTCHEAFTSASPSPTPPNEHSARTPSTTTYENGKTPITKPHTTI